MGAILRMERRRDRSDQQVQLLNRQAGGLSSQLKQTGLSE